VCRCIFSSYVAVCCSVLQCVAVCCSVLQCVAVCCSVWQCVAVYCNVLQCLAVCCSVLQCVSQCLLTHFCRVLAGRFSSVRHVGCGIGTNFSKVHPIVILHRESSSELTLRNFSKVRCTVMLYQKIRSKLTFEKFLKKSNISVATRWRLFGWLLH